MIIMIIIIIIIISGSSSSSSSSSSRSMSVGLAVGRKTLSLSFGMLLLVFFPVHEFLVFLACLLFDFLFYFLLGGLFLVCGQRLDEDAGDDRGRGVGRVGDRQGDDVG